MGARSGVRASLRESKSWLRDIGMKRGSCWGQALRGSQAGSFPPGKEGAAELRSREETWVWRVGNSFSLLCII